MPQPPPFRDRVHAGQRLADALAGLEGDIVVLGIPRGGVPVAAEVAKRLGAPLDVVVARKLGAPGFPELAIGAVTAHGGRYLNQEIINELAVSDAYLDHVTEVERREAQRREERFRAGEPAQPLAGRVVVIVDDGVATGATIRAAARSVRAQGPARLIIAVPVGAEETCRDLAAEADQVVCLETPEPFYAVGMHYQNFEPTDDATVVAILQAARRRSAKAAAPGGRSPTGGGL